MNGQLRLSKRPAFSPHAGHCLPGRLCRRSVRALVDRRRSGFDGVQCLAGLAAGDLVCGIAARRAFTTRHWLPSSYPGLVLGYPLASCRGPLSQRPPIDPGSSLPTRVLSEEEGNDTAWRKCQATLSAGDHLVSISSPRGVALNPVTAVAGRLVISMRIEL
jgi:hypothetical protein